MEPPFQRTEAASNESSLRSASPVSTLEEHVTEQYDDAGEGLVPNDHTEEEASLDEKSQTQRKPPTLAAWTLQYKTTIATILGLYLLGDMHLNTKLGLLSLTLPQH
jgi:hypothetical protein